MDIDKLIYLLQQIKDEYGESCYIEAYTDQIIIYDRISGREIKSIMPSFD